MKSARFDDWFVFTAVLVVALKYQRISFDWILMRIRGYLLFLPVMVVIYVLFSILLSVQTLEESVYTGTLTLVKFLSLIVLMTVFIHNNQNDRFLNSVRSLWVKTGLRWKWVDHGFLFIHLVLRFFPTVQHEWESSQKAVQAIGIPVRNRKLGKLLDILSNVPALVVVSLRKSDTMARIIARRGYGKQFPRGIVNPVDLEFSHVFAIVLITIFLIGADRIATL